MDEIEQKWTKEAANQLVGKKIVLVRYMTEKEKEEMLWYHRAIIIQFDDGSLLIPSTNDAANDGGILTGQTAKGEPFDIPRL